MIKPLLDDVQLLELYNQQLIDREIAEILHIGRKRVLYWRHKNKLPPNRDIYAQHRRRLCGEYKCGVPMQEALSLSQCDFVKAFIHDIVRDTRYFMGKVTGHIVNDYMQEWKRIYGKKETGRDINVAAIHC